MKPLIELVIVSPTYTVVRVEAGWVIAGVLCTTMDAALDAVEAEDKRRKFIWDMPTRWECREGMDAMKLGEVQIAEPKNEDEEDEADDSKASAHRTFSSFQVLDFSAMGFPAGLMVRRSDHCMKDRCMTGKPQVGIITDFRVYGDAAGLPVVWPVVAWEGDRCPAITATHPALVDVMDERRADIAIYRKLEE